MITGMVLHSEGGGFLPLEHAANLPIYFTIIATVVGIIASLYGIYHSYASNAVEKSKLDIEAIAERRETLESHVNMLGEENERLQTQLNQVEDQNKKHLDCINELESQNRDQRSQIETLRADIEQQKAIIAEQKEKMQIFEDRLLEARMMVSILTEQKKQMAKRFGIPMSIGDIIGKKNV